MPQLREVCPTAAAFGPVPELEYDEDLGFYHLPGQSAAHGLLRLVGFGAPYDKHGGFDQSKAITPITDIADIDVQARRIDEFSKGVGPHMYNTPQAMAGNKFKPPVAGVYSFDVSRPADDLYRWFDARQQQGSALKGLATQFGKIIDSRRSGNESVIKRAEAAYGDADIVRLKLPPKPRLRQLGRLITNPVPPQFLLIRSADITLVKIAEIDLPTWRALDPRPQ